MVEVHRTNVHFPPISIEIQICESGRGRKYWKTFVKKIGKFGYLCKIANVLGEIKSEWLPIGKLVALLNALFIHNTEGLYNCMIVSHIFQQKMLSSPEGENLEGFWENRGRLRAKANNNYKEGHLNRGEGQSEKKGLERDNEGRSQRTGWDQIWAGIEGKKGEKDKEARRL